MSDTANVDRPLPSNFVVYDHDDPSPLFPPAWVAYIESISADFAEQDLKRIRTLERFALNLNTGLIGNGGIPGLRRDSDRDHLYFRRFSRDSWRKAVQALFACVPDDFHGCTYSRIDLCRFTLPNGDRYYPITFFGDLERWRRELPKAAEHCGTLLARFEKGKFVLSDGQTFDFSSLQYDHLPPGKDVPRNW